MNCDLIAPVYRAGEYATFGRALERRRRAFLPRLAECREAVVLGDGDGRFTAALLMANPHARVRYIELSVGMLRLAERRVAKLGASAAMRVTFEQVDAREMVLENARYDLITTHFFLDCFSQADAELLIRKLTAAAAPGALWAVSDFQQLDTGAGRVLTSAVIRALYLAFRLTTGLTTSRIPDHRTPMANAGWRVLAQERGLGGLLVSELWQKA